MTGTCLWYGVRASGSQCSLAVSRLNCGPIGAALAVAHAVPVGQRDDARAEAVVELDDDLELAPARGADRARAVGEAAGPRVVGVHAQRAVGVDLAPRGSR